METWLTIPQLARLADAIDERYRAMVILAGRTGLRFGECAALLWSNLELDAAYDDGAVAGVRHLTVEAISAPARPSGVRIPPKTRATCRTIALDAETMEALKGHRESSGGDPAGREFTKPDGSCGLGEHRVPVGSYRHPTFNER